MPTSDSTPPTAAENMYHIRKELERISGCVASLKVDVTSLKVEMGKQIIKSGVVSLIGGSIPVIGAIGIAILLYFMKG